MRHAFVKLIVVAALCLFSLGGPVLALAETPAQPQKELTGKSLKIESALEKRVRVIASQLRCPVCQGESIYDSHSDVAVEMKQLIAEKLSKGESEAEILSYFQARYGNFILMEPPTEGLHFVIWLFPVFLGLVGFMLIYQVIMSRSQPVEETGKDTGGAPSSKPDQQKTDNEDGKEVPDVRELHL